jgi:hypothetical protein
VEKSRMDDQRLAGKAKRNAAERHHRQMSISRKLAEAKKFNDARAFGKALWEGEIREGSPKWKRAWDYFYGPQP